MKGRELEKFMEDLAREAYSLRKKTIIIKEF